MSLFPLSPQMHVLTKRVDVYGLYPPFATLWFSALLGCHARGEDFFAISGFRDAIREQRPLFAKGRKLLPDGTWKTISHKATVTDADAWQSTHNYGIGGDACKDEDADRAGLQPDWNLEEYEIYAQECEKVGLEAALRWKRRKEGPHAQLPIGKYGITTARLKLAHDQGGMTAVWKFLDGYDWSVR